MYTGFGMRLKLRHICSCLHTKKQYHLYGQMNKLRAQLKNDFNIQNTRQNKLNFNERGAINGRIHEAIDERD